MLIGARAAQGLGAALAAPNALAILSSTFAEGPERNRAMGIFGAAGGAAAAFSSVLGGVLVQGPGWPWAFFLNVPVGIVLVARSSRACRPTRRAANGRAPTSGAIALTAGLMAVAFGVHRHRGRLARAGRRCCRCSAGSRCSPASCHEGRARTPLIPLATCASRRWCGERRRGPAVGELPRADLPGHAVPQQVQG